MFDYMGWSEAAKLVYNALEHAIENKQVTYDLERLMKGATKLSTSNFAATIVKGM